MKEGATTRVTPKTEQRESHAATSAGDVQRRRPPGRAWAEAEPCEAPRAPRTRGRELRRARRWRRSASSARRPASPVQRPAYAARWRWSRAERAGVPRRGCLETAVVGKRSLRRTASQALGAAWQGVAAPPQWAAGARPLARSRRASTGRRFEQRCDGWHADAHGRRATRLSRDSQETKIFARDFSRDFCEGFIQRAPSFLKDRGGR
jgi:hypothetical protein